MTRLERDPPVPDTAAPAWAVAAAHLAALVPLPSSVWRLLLAAGFPAGYTAAGHAALDPHGWGAAYLVVLSLGTEAAALLTLGLVRPWGETVPGWVPGLGGRTVPVLAAVVPASLGVLVLTVLWTPFLAWWAIPHPDMTATGAFLVGFAYLPLVLWAPLLALVTWSFWRRRVAPAG